MRKANLQFVLAGLLLVPILWQQMPVVEALRLASLDAYQVLSPRKRVSLPAVIVAIDESSLSQFGQWPWPRTLISRLLDTISAADPAAIGIDIMFSEPDRTSPEWLARLFARSEPSLAKRLAALPRNDAALAESIRKARVALGVAGVDAESTTGPERLTPSIQRTSEAVDSLRRYGSTLRSLPEIDSAALGHGLLSVEPEGGIVRRVPLVAKIGTSPILSLSMETLRVASGEPSFALYGTASGVTGVGIGDLVVPTQADGRLWLHYSPHDPARFVSAGRLLKGDFDRTQLERKLVLVGVTGLGLVDYPTTVLGERIPGVEIHAQVLENVFEGSLLKRPPWSRWVEAAAFVAASLIVMLAVPRISPAASIALILGILAVFGLAGFAAYRESGWLFDASVPGAALLGLFAAILAQTLAESNAQRDLLRERLRREREDAARVSGELDAARRIQTGILPRPESIFPVEQRFEISALMEPAREVGGDLYDFFMLDDDRLFFIVGDVSGKGLPASIFMAVSKALCKSVALRGGMRVNELLAKAGEDIARENPESLFVTALAGVLDVRTGLLEYCNAGHEPPFVFQTDGEIARLNQGGGPPLCVVDGFTYEAAECRLSRGATLCVVSDGVTEAMNKSGQLYGARRLLAAIEKAQHIGAPRKLADAIRADVGAFVAGAEPADDLTLLVLRWSGPSAR